MIPQDLKDIIPHWETVASQIVGKDVVIHVSYPETNRFIEREKLVYKIKQGISLATNIEIKDIECKGRKRGITELRAIAYYLAYFEYRKLTQGLTLVWLGEQFGRDHSTVKNGLKTFDDLYNRDKQFTQVANACIDEVKLLIR